MDFSYEPHAVRPGTPQWNVLATDMEGMTKKTRLISTRSKMTWELEFRLQTKAERDLLLAHYNGQNGSLTPFNWTSVPSYIDSTSTYYVRYVEYVETLIATLFNVVLKFEEAL